MNLADEQTWKKVRTWMAAAGSVVVYLVGFGLTAVLYATHLSQEVLSAAAPEFAAALFWPVTLPVGMAFWYPWETLGAGIVLIGTAVLILADYRHNHLQAAEDAKLIDEAGL